jgi:L-lactate dehydrogenase (cytochrome)
MPFRIGPRQFIDFALHPRWSLKTLAYGKPQMANFDRPGFAFDRTASRAKADWAMLQRLRDAWPGKLVVKGVLDVEDAQKLAEAQVDAVQVSSHGARQLDSAPAPFERLQEIRKALPDMPIFYDSGIRSGEDVLKVLKAGADFVFLGRPVLFALAAAGEEGLARVWDILSEELSIAMAMTGQTKLT